MTLPSQKPLLPGAGGTPGGIGSFILGFLMMCVGWYWILKSVVVTDSLRFGYGLYHPDLFGNSFSISGGMILVPLIFGVGMIFFNARNILGWLLALGSLAALLFGVLINLQFSLRGMSLFDLLVVLILAVGGTGLFLRSLRDYGSER